MKTDPAIDEIRAVRHEISEEYDHDSQALVAHYQELDKQFQNRLIKVTGRRGTVAKAAQKPVTAHCE